MSRPNESITEIQQSSVRRAINWPASLGNLSGSHWPPQHSLVLTIGRYASTTSTTRILNQASEDEEGLQINPMDHLLLEYPRFVREGVVSTPMWTSTGDLILFKGIS